MGKGPSALRQLHLQKRQRVCTQDPAKGIRSQLFRNPTLEELATHVPPLMDYITNVAIAMGPTNPEFLNTYGNVLESAEDIRTLLKRLIELCDQK